MAIRMRRVGGILVALCAVETDPTDGDVYLDDEQDHALRVKFTRDYKSEGIPLESISYPDEDARAESQKVRDAEAELVRWLAEGKEPDE